VLPPKVEGPFTSPDAGDDAPPFFALFVAVVVLLFLHAEHLELILVPATHDVYAEPALANVVHRGELLGRHQGMNERHVHVTKLAKRQPRQED